MSGTVKQQQPPAAQNRASGRELEGCTRAPKANAREESGSTVSSRPLMPRTGRDFSSLLHFLPGTC